jgi:hypothetical protein
VRIAGNIRTFRTDSGGITRTRRLPTLRIRTLSPIALVAALICFACSGVNPLTGESSTEKVQSIEPALQAAGFKQLPATTPAQMQQLKALTQLKLGYYVDQSGNANYWLADADSCHCLFHGDEAARQRYETIKLENEVAERDREQSESRQRQMMMGQPGFGPPGMGLGFGSGFGGGFGGSGFGLSF